MPASRLAIVILAVDDLAAMKAFYVSMLGWPALVDEPVYVELREGDGPGLGLYLAAGFARNIGGVVPAPPAGLTRTELYLRCDDPAAALARAIAAGAPVLSPLAPRPWGDDAAYVSDPEGNVIALAWPSRI